MRSPSPLPGLAGLRAQRGVATLVVVMVLFFVVAMVAAYTSRNLIFEQKTSANNYRSQVAFEAAEAGVEWALAMLNGGLIDNNCDRSAAAGGTSFQQRYLRITAAAGITNGRITSATSWPTAASDNWPACVLSPTGWGATGTCKCPSGAALAPGEAPQPAFRVWPVLPDPPTPPPPPTPSPLNPNPGQFTLHANGCTRMPAGTGECLDLDPLASAGDAVASLRVVVALRPGLNTMPSAAITAQGGVALPAAPASLALVNADRASNGLTINAGGAIANASTIVAESLPGTPGELTVIENDPKLASLSVLAAGGTLGAGERMFVSQFGMRRALYRAQPGLRGCPGFEMASCTSSTLAAALARHPNRILWVDGDLSLTAGTVLGTNSAPVLLVINGSTLRLDQGATVVGMIYMTGNGAATPGLSTIELPSGGITEIRGALVAEAGLAISYPSGTPAATNRLKVTYDREVLNVLRTSYGSWVRLPGGWRDFRTEQ